MDDFSGTNITVAEKNRVGILRLQDCDVMEVIKDIFSRGSVDDRSAKGLSLRKVVYFDSSILIGNGDGSATALKIHNFRNCARRSSLCIRMADTGERDFFYSTLTT